MPAYNFQKQFVAMILSGKKPHTIRKPRKRPTKVGDTIMMFVGMRTKRCFQFAEARCIKVTPILLDPFGQTIINRETNQFFTKDELADLARHDGFEHFGLMFHFFTRYKKSELEMEIIEWNPDEMTRRVLLFAPSQGKSQPMGKTLEDTYSHQLIEVLTEKGMVHNAL